MPGQTLFTLWGQPDVKTPARKNPVKNSKPTKEAERKSVAKKSPVKKSPVKKSAQAVDATLEAEEWQTSGHKWIGVKLARRFKGGIATGRITHWVPAGVDNPIEDMALWRMMHDDGDLEELEEYEVDEAVKTLLQTEAKRPALFAKSKAVRHKRPKPQPRKKAKKPSAPHEPPVAVAPAPPPVVQDTSQLSAYEKQRLANIKRNNQIMQDLGLAHSSLELRQLHEGEQKKKENAKRARDKWAAPAVSSRSSKRKRGSAPDYTGEKIDKFGEDLDIQVDGQGKRVAQPLPSRHSKPDYSEVIAAAKEMREKRLQESKTKGLQGVELAKGQAKWRDEAVKRWGSRVALLELVDWEAYVVSRNASPAPASPLELMQERYVTDIWRLLIACTLMSRVSSLPVKEKAIGSFFSRYTNASEVLEGDPTDMFEMLKPLGLFDNRLKSVIGVSEKWIEMPVFEVGLGKGGADKSLKIPGECLQVQ
jgi:endonuclease III